MRKLILLAITIAILFAINFQGNTNPINDIVTQCSIDMATNSNLICD